MKKLPVIVVVLLSGFLVQRFVIADPPPVKTYKSFVKALAKGDRAEAEARSALAPEVFDAVWRDFRGQGAWPMQSINGVSVEVNTKEHSGDVWTITAVPVLIFNPPGVESAMGSMGASFDQTATVTKSDGGWKVTKLEHRFKAAEEIRR